MLKQLLARLSLILLILAAPAWTQAPIEEPDLGPAQQQSVRDLPPPPGRMLNLPAEGEEGHAPPEGPAKLSKEQVTRSVLGFVVVLILAYLAGHPKLQSLEERLHVGATTLTGFSFVLLGLLAATGDVKVLTSAVIEAIEPVVPFCLGWVGFRHGFGYSQEILLKPPSPSGVVAALVIPGALAMGGGVALIAGVNSSLLADNGVWRDLAIFALACGTTALAPVQRIERLWHGEGVDGPLEVFVKMGHLAAIALLMLLAVYFRPQGTVVAWQLPESAWLSFLRLAVIPVCFVAGLIVASLPGTNREQIRAVLDRTQRPALFVLFVIAGALWRPSAWQGWALLAVFLFARFAGNWLAVSMIARWMSSEFTTAERRALAYAPTGALSVAILLSARDLYPDSRLPYSLTAVIMGALLGEVLLQSRFWRTARATEAGAR